MNRIIYIEYCNFIDYPLGGHLSFAKHLTKAMCGDLSLVGCTTDCKEPVGRWYTKEIEGFRYPIYNIDFVRNSFFRKPLIPVRIRSWFVTKRHIKRLQLELYETILVQTPEILFALPKRFLPKVCLVMPGIENPLSNSRYIYAKYLAKIYNLFFYKRASKVSKILAAADTLSIQHFITQSRGLLYENRVYQFPTRYDADIFNKKDRDRIRSSFHIALSEIVVVITGRLGRLKGWKLVIDSFVLFRKRFPEAHLYFIGDGEDRHKIEDYLITNNYTQYVTLLGRLGQETISEYLNIGDLFVMGSNKEGWSTSLVEAVVSEIPCVVTNFSSARDLVVDGINGYVVDNQDPMLFAKKMELALRLNRDGIAERAAWCKRFSIQNMRAELESIIS